MGQARLAGSRALSVYGLSVREHGIVDRQCCLSGRRGCWSCGEEVAGDGDSSSRSNRRCAALSEELNVLRSEDNCQKYCK